jgi:Ca2+-transporting ATPase
MSKLDTKITNLQSNPSLETFRKLHLYLYKRRKQTASRSQISSTADSSVSVDALYYESHSKTRHTDLITFAVYDYDEGERQHLTSHMYSPNYIEQKLTKEQAQTLFRILLKYAGYKQQNSDRKLDEIATLAVEVFCYLLINDNEFRKIVEQQNSSTIRNLRLKDHILQGTDEHKKIVAKLVLFLATHVKRFENWERFVAEEGIEEVKLQMTELHNWMELTKHTFTRGEDHLPPMGSYHDVSAQAVSLIFKTDAEIGLKSDVIQRRREEYGENTLPKPKRPSVVVMLLKQIFDFMVLLLIIASGVSFAMQDYAAAIVLLVVVAFNVIVGFSQELKAEKAMKSLLSVEVQQASVMRDGQQQTIPAAELVPGDLVLLDEGIQIPADIHLIEQHDLSVNEALLSGESLPSEKSTDIITQKNTTISDRKNMVYMSTYVTKGRGKGIVVSTGKNTEIGKISETLSTAKMPKTRLEKTLRTLGIILVILSLVVCAIMTTIGFIRGFETIEIIKTGVSLAVSVIPEGLVAVTTFTMALSVQRMAKKHVIVRKMPSVETLGSVTVICADKTGTVTEGKMEMSELYSCGEKYRLNVDGHYYLRKHLLETIPNHVINILQVCALCNNSTVQEKDPTKKKFNERYETTGDPTEVALLVAAHKSKHGKDYWINEKNCHFEEEFSFDSDRKRMSVVYSVRHDNRGCTHILSKGAPESILEVCSSVQQKDGTSAPLSPKIAESLRAKSLEMAANGLRVLALAERICSVKATDESMNEVNSVEKDLRFLGFVGLIDPPRLEVANSIKKCKRAGIRVCMITGDHPSTARYVAQKLHMIPAHSEPNSVLTGKDIDQLVASNKLDTLDPFPQVFARVSPENKIQIVTALQKQGEVVAMIGDGINDAGAIKTADVGVAMGQDSTDVAKEAATIILADNNFTSIVEAVKEGRHTFDNIKIFVLYLLSCNFSELLLMFVAIASYSPIPFSPIQILWANLIADTPPALSLGIEPVAPGVLKRLPRNPKRGLFGIKGWTILIYQCLVMTGIALAGFLVSIYVEHYTLMHARSFTFALLITVQLIHAFHSRSTTQSILDMGVLGNKWLVAALLFSFSLVVCGIHIPKLNRMLDFTPLTPWDWCKVFIGCILFSTFIELSKIILRRLAKRKAPHQKFYSDV